MIWSNRSYADPQFTRNLQRPQIPPATQEVARLYKTSVDELKADRLQAVNMIIAHSLMRAVNEVRDQGWSREDRNKFSEQIDAYAQRKILERLKDDSFIKKLRKKTANTALKPINHYALGISEREKHVLTRMTQTLMTSCLTDISNSNEKTDLHKRPLAEQKTAYKDFSETMQSAFRQVFRNFDQKVRGASVVGVDAQALEDLDTLLPHPKSDSIPTMTDPWLLEQKTRLSDALNEACENLPRETRNAWKRAYAQQFQQMKPVNQKAAEPSEKTEKLRIDPDLQQISETADAIYALRKTRLDEANAAPKVRVSQEEILDFLALQEFEWLKGEDFLLAS